MTAIFFAWNGNSWADKTLQEWDWEGKPLNILVSFAYLSGYRRAEVKYQGRPRNTMLDSGAFTAWKSGKQVDIDALIAECRDGGWDESVALDVIGDSEGSIKNSHYMREAGLSVIPVFHYGEPWEVLDEYCKFFGHVGLSCRFGEPQKKSIAWIEQCFARHWPHCFHSFGWVDLRILDRVPFDTADASTWQMGPTAFGTWRSMGAKNIGVRCTTDNPLRLDSELDYYLEWQRSLEAKWHRELSETRTKNLGASLAKRRLVWT